MLRTYIIEMVSLKECIDDISNGIGTGIDNVMCIGPYLSHAVVQYCEIVDTG